MKAMLATDYSESKIQWPVIALPKIDGVRGLNMEGVLTGRSLKRHANVHTTELFSIDAFIGFDGELAAGGATDPDLCRKTSSALSTIKGEPEIDWWLFDFVTPETVTLGYNSRMSLLQDRLTTLHSVCPQRLRKLMTRIRMVEGRVCHTLQQLYEWEEYWVGLGYEGVIIRDPDGAHKQGRSTVREGGYLRIKRFTDGEVVVTRIEEGERNTNPAQTNELGLQYRTTHKDNMVPNGLVGTLYGRDLKTGAEVKISPGKMPHKERKFYFENPDQLIGKIAKYKHFDKGVKDALRFATYQGLRSETDMGGE